MINKIFAKIILLVLITVMQGCSNLSEFSDSVISNIPVINYLTGSKYCTVKIKSSKNTNQGAPFYLVAKSTNFSSFLSENYQEIAELLNNPPKDESCFEIFCIVPGKDQVFNIERTTDLESVGFYFLFTEPGSRWKQIVEIINGNPVIKIVLGKNEVVSIN